MLQGSNSANVFLCLWQPSFSHSCSKLEKKRHGLYHMLKFQGKRVRGLSSMKNRLWYRMVRWFLAYRLFFLNMLVVVVLLVYCDIMMVPKADQEKVRKTVKPFNVKKQLTNGWKHLKVDLCIGTVSVRYHSTTCTLWTCSYGIWKQLWSATIIHDVPHCVDWDQFSIVVSMNWLVLLVSK